MSTETHLNFHVATANDASQIAQLIQAAFRAEDNGTAWTGPDVVLNRTFTLTPEEVLSTINNPEAEFLIAKTEDGTLVGAMAAIKRSDELARLAMLAVDQSYQRSGLGRRVLANAEDYVQKNWGVKKIGLNALNTRGLLLEWYERQGYVRTGEKSPFPVKAFRDIELPEDLHFVEMEKDLGG
ncbi:hypothetical protein GRF29_44g2091010 [Pseudopithomyces chartarum]|uniref:N-acetyltransferase domain-containing protein n=1 Tax=Pseudopithomyces chartarum TaxID=1892770 RepID=A0AAN6RHD1_9PLEO|nr:hypothetical protein GRF29_44g2091010 [Pseudopithomyces chartarum]